MTNGILPNDQINHIYFISDKSQSNTYPNSIGAIMSMKHSLKGKVWYS